jgi:hypothetical protein
MPKGASEQRVTVRDDGLGHAMEFEDMRKENMGNNGGCVWVRQGKEVTVFREMVNNHKKNNEAMWKG